MTEGQKSTICCTARIHAFSSHFGHGTQPCRVTRARVIRQGYRLCAEHARQYDRREAEGSLDALLRYWRWGLGVRANDPPDLPPCTCPEGSRDPFCKLGAYRNRQGLTTYSRSLTDAERDVLKVAAEIVRRRHSDDVSDEMDETMREWSHRLKASHDELLERLRIHV